MPGAVFHVTLADRLPMILPKIAAGIGVAVRETLIEIEQDVKGGPHAAPIRTGNLRRSYHHEMTGKTSGIVGNDMGVAEYAIYVELGTSKMAPRPHIIPATEAQREPFNRRISAAIHVA